MILPPVFLGLVVGCGAYLIALSAEDEPGLVFDGGLPGGRSYAINAEKSAVFVRRLLHVEKHTGKVVLRRKVECGGLRYPDLFTIYLDSYSNTSLDYVSVPLRVLIRGCARLISFQDGMVVNKAEERIAEAKNWPCETIASFAFPIYRDTNGVTKEVCLKASQQLGHLHSLIPSTVRSSCSVDFSSPDDPRFAVEGRNGDLVVGRSDICVDQSGTTTVTVPIAYTCSGKVPIISPGHSELKVSIWFKPAELMFDTGRVRRTLRLGESTFDKPLYVATVLEEQAPGVEVCTIAISHPGTRYSMVSLLDARSSALFTIGSNDGIVTTTARLDREMMDVHYFRITAMFEDGGAVQSRSATTTLQVNVGDVNDHAPQFEGANLGGGVSNTEASLSESSPIGTVVAQLRATDLDIGINSQIEYALVDVESGGLDTGEGVFSIDPQTGLVTTRQPLDRETTEVYTIVAQASDSAQPLASRLTSTVSLVVRVKDENDNYPQFGERTITVELPEEEKTSFSNPVVAHIKATDADAGPNGALRYAIIGGNTQGQFAIDSQNGELTLVKPLDYEAVRSYRLVIRAQDGGSPGKSNTTQVLVNVKDYNDNAPRFYTSLFQESVSENVPVGFSIVRVQAYDGDEGENSEIEYRISSHFNPGNLPVSVDPVSGWLYTNKHLDREAEPKLHFEVLAVDHGTPSKTGTATVSVDIQDTNDNDPVFSPKEYSANLQEDIAPGTSVVAVHATDPDENPRLHYEISSGNTRGRFAITTQNGRGLITVAQPLDYKQEKRFVLIVRATDSGGRYDSANVYLNITDANTFAPLFDNAPYSSTIPEDAKVGTTVLVVSATDGDTGVNAQITYSLTSETDHFTINADTGAVITTDTLDRETTSGYLLSVTARDNGTPQLSDTTDVEITVTDVNDNAPKFLQEGYTVSISEDVPIGTSVIQVSATDSDVGLNGRVRYSLEETDTFIMEPITGVVRVNRALDRESVASYKLVVIASDRATPPLSSSVVITINIEDVNDSPPTFSSDRLTLYIPENSPVGSTVGEIYASDPDVGINAIVQYSIIGGDDASSFSLQRRAGSDRAELITLTELDYESDKKEYQIVIRATSAPLRSDARLTVVVTDVNDNAPILPDFQVIFNNFRECFPSGPIGKIPATDADVTDKLRYRLISGNNAHLVSLNESTGELTLSPQLNTNVPKVATMEVSVSDGVNEVKAWMELTVRLITDDMLMNSVTVRLAEMTVDAFLSPLYSYFIEAIAAIIPCPKHNVYVFSAQDDPDVGDTRILNVSFSVRQPEGYMLPAQLLQERVHLNRALLNKLSTLQVLQFDDNLCVREPCLNFEECITILKFGNASGFVASETMLFRPIYPVTTFACRCPKGFIGKKEHYLCDTEVNLCYSNPCKNGGECFQAEGGFTCLCKPGFSGETCETDLTESCKDGCPDGSTCSPLESGGYTCESCAQAGGSFRNYGRSCEARARSFYPGSYLTFQPIRQRNRMLISLKFSTVESHGLLLYNGRYNLRHDFIALELQFGNSMQFSFSLGSKLTTVIATSNEPLNDGNWHTVTVFYYNKTATISLDDCDTAVAIKFRDRLNMTCAARETHQLESRCAIVTESCHRFLDLTGPLHLGGLPPGVIHPYLEQKSFAGCIADVHIDKKLVDLNKFVGNNGTKVGCVERDNFCSSSPCKNGGTCRDSWGTFICQCADGWSGLDCSQSVPPAWSFNGDGQLVFSPILRPIQLPWETHFYIRTQQLDSFILGISVGQNSSASFTVVNGYLRYSIDSDHVKLTSWRVADGKWHHVTASVAPGGTAVLMLDNTWSSTSAVRTNPQKQLIGKLNVAMEPGYQSFIGCIKDIRLGSWQGLQLVQNPTTATGVGEGCDDEAKCPDTCPPNRHCRLSDLSASCTCNTGYVGEECENICSLNPCENGGRCFNDRDSPVGYSCSCNGTHFTGDYCENERMLSCPSTWWGQPNCGPCNCDISKGYSPHCNQTDGTCYCKDNYYYVSEEIGCMPCLCYALGSKSSSCDQVTGQCDCKESVVGQHCDQCPNAYAQVTHFGCEVVYGGCPRSQYSGIWWEKTDYGATATVLCPQGSVGKATRLCDRALPGWRDPDMFNCTSNDFYQLRRLLNQLETGDVSLNTYVSTETSKSLANALNSTKTGRGRLYGADVLIGVELTMRLLQYESGLTGLALSHVQDAGYIQRLVWTVGELLSDRTARYWPEVEQITNQPPNHLHTLFTLYMTTLTSNMKDTYTQPFETISENMVLGLDTVSLDSLYGYEVISSQSVNTQMAGFKETVILPDTTNILQPPFQAASLVSRSGGNASSPTVMFPKYNNYLKSGVKFDEYSRILIPLELLGIGNVNPGEVSIRMRGSAQTSATLAYAVYRNGATFFPNRFDLTVTTRWGVALQLGSSVVTVVAANGEGSVLSSGLKSPIRIQLWLNQAVKSPRSNPQCVRWTHIRGFGEWTRAGCVTELPEGDWWKHSIVIVNCTCNTLSTHALFVDLVAEHYVREPTEAEEVYTWIGLCVSIWCLATCVLIIELTSRVGKANHSSIQGNFASCLLVAALLYLGASKASLTSHLVWCKLVAIGLHYVWLCSLMWSLIYSIHLYRMLTQLRDVNRGPMMHYYTLGYALPGIIVALAVAVRPDQYGNYYFCWISIHESVIWSMIGPGAVIIFVKLVILFMSLKAAFTVNQNIVAYGNLRTMLWVNVGCLPLLVAAWLAVLVTSSEHSPMATLCMAVLLPLHSAALLVSQAATSPTLRRLVLRLTNGKVPPSADAPEPSPPPRSAMAYRPAGAGTSETARRHLGISNSSTTSRSTTKTSSSPYRSDAQLRNTSTSTSNYEPSHERRVTHTSESESEGSEHSLELASSHSSDEEASSRRASTLTGQSGRPSNGQGSKRWPPPNVVSYPPQLNIDSDLFKAVYATARNDEGLPHRWTSSTISDNDLGGPVNNYHMQNGNDVKIGNVYSDQEDKASLGDKYLFPYTAEEDHSLPPRAYNANLQPCLPGYSAALPSSPSPLAMHHEYLYPDISENEKATSETHV
ncbi:protocadherin-like wing polarity protein stan isoform X2 [Cimex lectularius]|uniref:Protocadherin-like wing polarity protein stan n=1 Tax=Cimex lectularius TaxID=79782 RepID=A0A8I6RGX6_CIMLE|nr:protocadherin-like wing polarity protein stan isoform X2 [Cimex lectularius]